MLNWLIGDSGSGKTTAVLERISLQVNRGEKCFLLVPEQQTVTTEVLAMDALPANAPLLFEVTNFTRLADTVFRTVGGLSHKYATPAVEQLTMWKTLLAVLPMLHSQPAKIDGGTVSSYRKAVRDLRAMGLTGGELERVARNIPDAGLADKLRDYSLLSTIYHDLLCENWGDTCDRPDKLREVLEEKAPLKDIHIYIDGFSSFTEQEYRILAALLKTSPMTVTLSLPPNHLEQLCAGEVTDTYERLTALAEQAGTEVIVHKLEGVKRGNDPVLRYVTDRMFRVDYASLPPYEGSPSETLQLVDAPDPMEASDFIAGDIKSRVMEGAKYGDFAIVLASSQAYEGILDVSLRAAGIPYFFSAHTKLTSQEPVKAILSAYRILLGHWKREDVVSYLKCGFHPIDQKTVHLLECYLETWDLKGKGIVAPNGWHHSPDGLKPKREEREAYLQEVLETLNQAKDKFVPPLLALGEYIKSPTSVNRHIIGLTKFLLAMEYPEKLQTLGNMWLENGDRKRGELYHRLWDILCDTLDTLSHMMGEDVVSGEEFFDILHLLLEEESMGHIPPLMDEVTVGEASLLRSEGKQYLYLLGVNEDEFPAKLGESNTFTEQEKSILSHFGCEVGDTMDTRASRELFAFYRAMTLGNLGVTLIWTRLNPSFGEAVPSDAVKRIRKLLSNHYPVLTLTRDNEENRLYSPAMAYSRLGRLCNTPAGEAIRHVLQSDPAYAEQISAVDRPLRNIDVSLSPKTAKQLFKDTINLTQSKIEKYVGCPLSYYLHYILKLDEGEKAEFNAATTGSYIHAVLEGYLSHCQKEGLDHTALSDEERDRMVTQISGEILEHTLPGGLDNPRLAHLIGHLTKMACRIAKELGTEFQNSDFVPKLFEVKIDEKDKNAPDPLVFTTPGGRNIRVSGVIDRVDTYKEGDTVWVRVVDYKTGNKDFDLSSIDKGLDLQMLLYLFSIWKTDSKPFKKSLGISENGTVLPAGMIYYASLLSGANGEGKLTKEEAEALSHGALTKSGILLNDDHVLDHMDTTPEKDNLFIKKKKDGTFTVNSLKSLKTLEEMGELLSQVGNTLSQIGGRMENGDISATPLKQKGKQKGSACQYCHFKAICRNPK